MSDAPMTSAGFAPEGSSSLDRIELTGIRAWGRHGVLAAERELGQVFAADVVLILDARLAGETDDLASTVNYAEIAVQVERILSGEPVKLIETLAEKIAQAVFAHSVLVRAVEVRVRKPSAPVGVPVTNVSVSISRQAPAVAAVLALGSNLGDREEHLSMALASLQRTPHIEVKWASPVRETDPVGGPDQGAFLNAVVGVETTLSPHRLLETAQHLEREAARERSVRWGPRTLDVDVITYADLISEHPTLTLPHPRAHERAFVLSPWLAADPAAALPGHGPIAPLLAAAADRDSVREGPSIPGFGET